MAKQEIELAFNEIYNSTNKAILAYITAKCCNIEDISDIFQETYTEVFLVINKKGINYIKVPEAFVKRLAKQKIYKHYSASERRKMQISIIQTDKNGEEYDVSDRVINEISIEENYILTEKIDEVQKFLQSKSVLTRKIFHLFYTLDKTIPEISELLDVKQSTVKNHIYRTVKEIKEKFSEKEGILS